MFGIVLCLFLYFKLIVKVFEIVLLNDLFVFILIIEYEIFNIYNGFCYMWLKKIKFNGLMCFEYLYFDEGWKNIYL